MCKVITRAASLFVFLMLVPPTVASDKLVAGWVEPVVILPMDFNLNAKLDSGARHSSLNSRNIEMIEKDGTSLVRFDVVSREGRIHQLELPLMRNAKIKRHFGKSQQRPVVKMTICLDGISREAEVNLVDRSGFNYQLLLGRSYLAPDILIDSSAKNITEPKC